MRPRVLFAAGLVAAAAAMATATPRAVLSLKAKITYYYSYPPCCEDCACYDPDFPTEECTDYSGCKWKGQFAAPPYELTLPQVQARSIVSYFNRKKAHKFSQFANKRIRVVRADFGHFDAEILDTCADKDCSGCCSRNAGRTGNLIDVCYFLLLDFVLFCFVHSNRSSVILHDSIVRGNQPKTQQ